MHCLALFAGANALFHYFSAARDAKLFLLPSAVRKVIAVLDILGVGGNGGAVGSRAGTGGGAGSR